MNGSALRLRPFPLLPALLAVLLLAVACGSSEAEADDQASGTTTTAADTSRLVVLNGDLAEIAFALGLGDRVVATDSSATFPPAAVALPKIGYQRSLSAEGIIAQRPSLVLGSNDAGPPAVLDQLRTAGVRVVIIEERHDLDAPAAKIRAVGKALGVAEKADELAGDVQRDLDDLAAKAADVDDQPRVAVLYLRGGNVQLLFGDEQGAGTIADAVGAVPAVASKSTIPLTPEALVAAAPDALVVTTSGLQSVGGIEGLLRIPGVATTPAGKARRVFAYDDQMLLGFGPRAAACWTQLFDDLHGGQA
jgi:iron complex transport system substrate-binding protein